MEGTARPADEEGAAPAPRPATTDAGMAPLARSGPGAAPEDEEGGLDLQQHRLLLTFRGRSAEGEFAAEQAASRWRVLALVGAFDCAMFIVRGAVKLAAAQAVGRSLLAQLANMGLLYSLIALLNARTRRLGSRAAHQEEGLLCCLLSGTISLLLLSLRPGNAGDYVYAALFLTCTSAVLRLRWFVGTGALAAPVLAAAATNLRVRLPAAAAAAASCAAALGDGAPRACPAAAVARLGPLEFVSAGPLPLESLVHVLVAWAVGALMAFVSDSNRRESFVAHKLALAAAGKELAEARGRVEAERALSQAQRQAAARALAVAREKAASEAKSEFMSLMCHEVRTPLNGCLASAEMLLDTALDEEQRELAKTIRVSGSILLSTVSNFLDFFKIEAGKQLDIVRSSLDLRDLVADVHCIIEAMVGRERGVALLPPDLCGAPATVLGDPSRICGILLNLYTNAAKYTKRGCIGLRVRAVGPNYRPDPAAALSFCDPDGSGAATAAGSRPASQPGGSLSASATDTAADASRCSTPTDVVGAPAGVPSAAARAQAAAERAVRGKPGGAPAPRALYAHGGQAEHDSARSLRGGSSDAAGAADLLSRQAAAASAGVPHAFMSCVTEVDGWSSVHSQPDPNFVLRHSAAGAPQAASSGSDEDEGARFLCFEVLDTGVGVSRQALEALFQDYVQGTDSDMRRARSKGGTGLGLSICCKQVAVLGGALGALSKPGAGSVFWFTMPLVLPAHDTSSADSLEESEEEAAGGAGTGGAPAPQLAPAAAAGAAAIRRSLEASQAGGGGADAGDQLPSGIPASPHRAGAGGASPPPPPRQPSAESGGGGGGGGGARRSVRSSGSRRHSMESNLSSMWPSHHAKPPRVRSGGDLAELGDAYHPRNALSWETAVQPPSFTAAQMLQAMPLAAPAGGAAGAPARRPAGRASAASAVPHMGTARHQLPAAGAAAGGGGATGAAASAQRGAAAAAAAARSLAGLRVLLAEDNLINQTVAKRVLTSLGCQCTVASNGREAVAAVEEAVAQGRPYDVVLMDMCMPVLGGVEATREIRALGCGLPIVAMTANASERDRVECIAAGMDGFLSKPVLKEQLTVAIREATQAGRRR